MQGPRDDRSLGELFTELAQETSTLVRQEVNLAKTEMSQKASTAGRHAGVLAAGGAGCGGGGLLAHKEGARRPQARRLCTQRDHRDTQGGPAMGERPENDLRRDPLAGGGTDGDPLVDPAGTTGGEARPVMGPDPALGGGVGGGAVIDEGDRDDIERTRA